MPHRNLGSHICVIAAAVLAACAAAQVVPTPATRPAAATRPATATRPAPVPKASNPHWNTTDCTVCHRSANGNIAAPIPLNEVNALCWTCHDGKRAHQEVHPVARRFAGSGLTKPTGWPTPNDELSCITCHDFGPGHAKGGPRPPRNAWMLRGYTGGSLAPFCAKCHVSSPAHKPFNPHVMIAPDGEVNLRNCLLCHKETSDVIQRKTRVGKPDLLAEPMSLCARCHTRHPDWSERGHMGIRVPPGMKAYMLAREDAGLSATVTPEQVAAHRGLDRVPEWLPLAPGDKVVCSTCHNPHEAGLFPADSVLGYGGMKVNEPHRSPELRGLGKEVCRGCHNK